MRGLAGCPKIQKSIFSNRIFGFRSKRWIFGFPKVFFGFFWILRKGVWIFGFPSQKSKKTQGKRWIFAKIQLLAAFFWIFWKNPSFSLSFFGFLISGLEKSIFFLGFFGFLQKSIFFLGCFTFFENSIFFLEFFWIFDLETQKSKHPFEESQKIQKSLGTSKNPSF